MPGIDKRLVKVVWHDAEDHSQTWVDEADAEAYSESMCSIVSIGFLVRKTEKYVTLAGDWNEGDTDYGRVTKIPIGMVQSIDDLEVKAP